SFHHGRHGPRNGPRIKSEVTKRGAGDSRHAGIGRFLLDDIKAMRGRIASALAAVVAGGCRFRRRASADRTGGAASPYWRIAPPAGIRPWRVAQLPSRSVPNIPARR